MGGVFASRAPCRISRNKLRDSSPPLADAHRHRGRRHRRAYERRARGGGRAQRAPGRRRPLDRQSRGRRGAARPRGRVRVSRRSPSASCAATGTGRTCPTSACARPRASSSRGGSCAGSGPRSSSPPAASSPCRRRWPPARSASRSWSTSRRRCRDWPTGSWRASRGASRSPFPPAGRDFPRDRARPHRQSAAPRARRRVPRGRLPALRVRPGAAHRLRHRWRPGLAPDQPHGGRDPPSRCSTDCQVIHQCGDNAETGDRAWLAGRAPRRCRAPGRRYALTPYVGAELRRRLRGGGPRDRAQRRRHRQRVPAPRQAGDLHPLTGRERRRADGQRATGRGRRRRSSSCPRIRSRPAGCSTS